jgi:putative transposase
MRTTWKVSVRKACRVLRFDPKSYRYRSRRPGQAPLESRIKEICQTRVRYGYRRVHVMLRREGWVLYEKMFTTRWACNCATKRRSAA